MKQVLDTAETKHKFVKNVPRFYVHQLEQIPKPNFVTGVKDYLASYGVKSAVLSVRR